jgi:murein DD-endopeptidase MepM/ murein hydrolase activator NlpD
VRRLVLILLLLLGPVGSAAAYPWPVRPFNKQHPVRANFGDPRTVFQISLFQNGLEGPGEFQFHNGIDISAPDGTAVYPVASGTVKLIQAGSEISVRTDDNRVFQYFHLVPVVGEGEQVVAKQTLLGYIGRGFGHVHLTEIHGFHVWNPLAKGGIAPYRDTLKPRVTSIFMRADGSIAALDPLGVCGTVSIVAEAYDTPQMKVPGSFAGFPVSPTLLTWTMRKVGGGVLQPGIPAFDVRTTLPAPPEFWNVYARGTYQNAPRFANRQFSLMPGRFLYNLNSYFDTRTVANGVYQVSVAAEDTRGNRSLLNQRFTIVNQAGTATGCPPAPTPPRD